MSKRARHNPDIVTVGDVIVATVGVLMHYKVSTDIRQMIVRMVVGDLGIINLDWPRIMKDHRDTDSRYVIRCETCTVVYSLCCDSCTGRDWVCSHSIGRMRAPFTYFGLTKLLCIPCWEGDLYIDDE